MGSSNFRNGDPIFTFENGDNMHPYKRNIDSSKTTTLKTGDLVQFRNNRFLPKIYKNQLAVIVERYKTLNQFNMKYWNYFATIELLTGPNTGRKRSFCNPSYFLKKTKLIPITPHVRKELKIEKMNKKVKYKKLKNKNMGGSLKGYVLLNYDQLVSVFGKPDSATTLDHKIDWEWRFSLDNQPMYIYNYKTGPSYCRDKTIKPQHIDDWHIGGNNSFILNLLQNYLEQKLGSGRYVTGD